MRFRDVTISDYHAIQGYADKYGENSCQHSFINLFTLQEKYGSQFCIEDGLLFVLRSRLCTDGFRTYLFPMGGGDMKRAVEAVLEDAHAHNAKARFQTITEEKRDYLQREFPEVFDCQEVRDYAEYIHLTSNLAQLPGRKFSQKRSDAKLFRRTYEGRLEEAQLTKGDTDEVLAFERKWLEQSRESHDGEALEMELREIEKQLSQFDTLRISGLILRIDGIIQGFVYGAPISGECYDLLIEKGNREYRHIYRVLHQDIAVKCAAGYPYINIEEDVGVPGLRASKLSYKPDILLRKYIADER